MENAKKYKRNITLFYLKHLFTGLGNIWAPIIVAFQMHFIGLNLKQIFFAEALMAFTILIFEVPSGVFADKFGRKKTVVLGNSFITLAALYFTFANSLADVIITQTLFGIGLALNSGADQSLLYDSLKEINQENRFQKIFSKANSITYFSAVFATTFGGLLAKHFSFQVPIFLTFVFYLLGTISIVLLKETEIQHKEKKQRTAIKHSKKALKYILTNKYVRYTILFAIIIQIGIKINFHTLNPYWDLKKVPLEYFGFAFAGLNLISGLISHFAHTINKKIGEKNVLLLMYIVGSGTFFLVANINAGIFLALLLPAFYQINRALNTVAISHMINKITYSHHRATVISMKSFLVNTSQIIALPIFGLLTDSLGLLNSYNILGLFILLTGGFTLVHFRKNFELGNK